jgi:hypothetical protein
MKMQLKNQYLASTIIQKNMKKILLAIVFCCSMTIVNAQSADNGQATLQDSHHAVIGYVKPNGSIYDNNNVLVCQIKSNGDILDGKGNPMGYITMEQAIQDANHKTMGYVVNGASFQDVSHKQIGMVNNDGSIVAGDKMIVGYETNTEPMWAGLYFFMFKK